MEAIDDDVCSYDVLCFGEGGFGANDQGLSLAAIELQKVPAHPAPDVLESGGEGGGRKGSGGFGGYTDLCIISIAMKMDTMVMEDCAQGKEVDNDEEERTSTGPWGTPSGTAENLGLWFLSWTNCCLSVRYEPSKYHPAIPMSARRSRSSG